MRHTVQYAVCLWPCLLAGCGGSSIPGESLTRSSQVAPFEHSLRARGRPTAPTIGFQDQADTVTAKALKPFGIRPEHHVATAMLQDAEALKFIADLTRDRGSLTVVLPNMFDIAPERRSALAPAVAKIRRTLDEDPTLFANTKRIVWFEDAGLSLGADESLDRILCLSNIEHWFRAGRASQLLSASFEALRPQGTLGIYASLNTNETQLVELVESAGFILRDRTPRSTPTSKAVTRSALSFTKRTSSALP